MKKIKILGRGFMTTHFGYLEKEKEYQVSNGFADYCVKRMKSAVYCKTSKANKGDDKK